MNKRQIIATVIKELERLAYKIDKNFDGNYFTSNLSGLVRYVPTWHKALREAGASSENDNIEYVPKTGIFLGYTSGGDSPRNNKYYYLAIFKSKNSEKYYVANTYGRIGYIQKAQFKGESHSMNGAIRILNEWVNKKTSKGYEKYTLKMK